MDVAIPETMSYDAAAREVAVQRSYADDVPPSSVAGYQILRRIGAGKFGSVWLAREQNTGKLVAIKFYSQRRGVDWTLLGREVEKLAVLYTSRHIVGLLAVGWEHDPPYYVMEYLENGSLAEKLSSGPLPVSEVVRIGQRVALALVHAHGSGILHCDIKPANVLLDQDDEPRLCDFGQSRLADERSHSLGTLFYMAPEQADLRAVPDARWDVYALGALLYHMLVGEPPYRTDAHEAELRGTRSLQDRLEAYRRMVIEAPRPTEHRRVAGVDTALADIIDRCLATDPERRLANPQSVLDRLQSRERARARRPLLWTGMLLPVLLVAIALPFALDALRDTLTSSRKNLIARALEGNALSAQLLAGSLQRELDDRLNELLAIADDDVLREAIPAEASQPLADRKELFSLLDRKKKQVEDRRQSLGRSTDASWFLQDAQGYQRWRSPMSDTVDQRFACRDYFHGRGQLSSISRDDLGEQDNCADAVPISEPHVSAPYASKTSRQWKVALSIPVFDRPETITGKPRVIGVLARSLNLSALLADYQKSFTSEGHGRQLALVDARSGVLLAHPWLTDANLDRVNEFDDHFRVNETLMPQLEELLQQSSRHSTPQGFDRTDEYVDPVARLEPGDYSGNWLAAFAPVGQTGWIAIVQERRSPVVAPVDSLRERLVTSGIWGLFMVLGLVVACWSLIITLLNDRRPAWLRWLSGARSSRLRKNTANATGVRTGRISESA